MWTGRTAYSPLACPHHVQGQGGETDSKHVTHCWFEASSLRSLGALSSFEQLWVIGLQFFYFYFDLLLGDSSWLASRLLLCLHRGSAAVLCPSLRLCHVLDACRRLRQALEKAISLDCKAHRGSRGRNSLRRIAAAVSTCSLPPNDVKDKPVRRCKMWCLEHQRNYKKCTSLHAWLHYIPVNFFENSICNVKKCLYIFSV